MDIPSYEPAAALDFFKAGGEVETIPAGRTIFLENRRGRRSLGPNARRAPHESLR